MLIYENEFFIIVKKDTNFLGISKFDGSIHILKNNTPEIENQGKYSIECDIIIGKISFEELLPPRLVYVTCSTCIGEYLDQAMVYRIDSIDTIRIQMGDCIKSPNSNLMSSKLVDKFTNIGNWDIANNDNDNENEKIEKKMLAELYWMFNSSNTFYYSEKCDLSNTIERKHHNDTIDSLKNTPLFKKFDRRFFWNLYMINDFIEIYKYEKSIENFIIPIIRGFYDVKLFNLSSITQNISLKHGNNIVNGLTTSQNLISIILISKQSFLRSGTRFKCRGIDIKGYVANFVETEQIVMFDKSVQSFVIIRGSIPLFWQQPTTWKYRPPFILYNDNKINCAAFELHINNLTKLYNKLCIVNLVENKGREKLLRDAYIDYLLNSTNENIEIYDFDFHEHCKKNRFNRVNILINHIIHKIEEFKYFWKTNDDYMLQTQEGIFRVNCVDCLDRTNVVQAAISKMVMMIQLKKLGIIINDSDISENFTLVMNNMWASNGDNISQAYAGTDALKSDYTRTGERNIGGVMLDGYKSLNRYYSNLFRDATRQVVHDIMHGKAKSASKCLSQWKLSLESTLQKETNASKAINFDIASFLDDSKSSLDHYNANNLLRNGIIKCCLNSCEEFIKFWPIKPYYTTKQKTNSHFIDNHDIYNQDQIVMVLCHSFIKIATFINNNELQRHCDIPMSRLIKLKTFTKGGKLSNTLHLIFNNVNNTHLCINFQLINDEDDDDHYLIDNFCKIFTSYINEAGNFNFSLDYIQENDLDNLETFFTDNCPTDLNIEGLDFFEQFYWNIPLNGYYDITTNNDSTQPTQCDPLYNEYSSTYSLSDKDLISLDTKSLDICINSNHGNKEMNTTNLDFTSSCIGPNANAFDFPHSISIPNIVEPTKYNIPLPVKCNRKINNNSLKTSEKCGGSIVEEDSSKNPNTINVFNDTSNIYNDNVRIENNQPLFKSPSMSTFKNKLSSATHKAKSQISHAGQRTKSQIKNIGNMFRGMRQHSVSNDTISIRSQELPIKNDPIVIMGSNGKTKLVII